MEAKFYVEHASWSASAAITGHRRLRGLSNRKLFLTVLEAGGPRSRCQPFQFLVRFSSQLADAWPHLAMSSFDKEWGSSLIRLLTRSPILLDENPPLWPHLTLMTSLKTHLQCEWKGAQTFGPLQVGWPGAEAPGGFPGCSAGEESACSAGDPGDTGLIPRLGISPGGGHGNSLQYSCLENLMDRGSWQATVHGVTESQTLLKWLSVHAYIHIYVYLHKHIHTYIYTYINTLLYICIFTLGCIDNKIHMYNTFLLFAYQYFPICIQQICFHCRLKNRVKNNPSPFALGLQCLARAVCTVSAHLLCPDQLVSVAPA